MRKPEYNMSGVLKRNEGWSVGDPTHVGYATVDGVDYYVQGFTSKRNPDGKERLIIHFLPRSAAPDGGKLADG